MDDENLKQRKERIKIWMMIEFSKMKKRDISSGLLKKVIINGNEECVLNEEIVNYQILLPFDAKESILIEFFCKYRYIEWYSKIEFYRHMYGNNS
jgi:hypothetical protein